MIPPKEKAKELVEKFLPFVDWNDLIDDSTNREWAIRDAKQCALIAVEEIINEVKHSRKCFRGGSEMSDKQLIYWQEVKQEIEKL